MSATPPKSLVDILDASLLAGGPLHERACRAERALRDATEQALAQLARAEDATDDIDAGARIRRAFEETREVQAAARRFESAVGALVKAIRAKRAKS